MDNELKALNEIFKFIKSVSDKYKDKIKLCENWEYEEMIKKGYIKPSRDLKDFKQNNFKRLCRYFNFYFSKAFDYLVKTKASSMTNRLKYIGVYRPLYPEFLLLLKDCSEQNIFHYLLLLLECIHQFILVRKHQPKYQHIINEKLILMNGDFKPIKIIFGDERHPNIVEFEPNSELEKFYVMLLVINEISSDYINFTLGDYSNFELYASRVRIDKLRQIDYNYKERAKYELPAENVDCYINCIYFENEAKPFRGVDLDDETGNLGNFYLSESIKGKNTKIDNLYEQLEGKKPDLILNKDMNNGNKDNVIHKAVNQMKNIVREDIRKDKVLNDAMIKSRKKGVSVNKIKGKGRTHSEIMNEAIEAVIEDEKRRNKSKNLILNKGMKANTPEEIMEKARNKRNVEVKRKIRDDTDDDEQNEIPKVFIINSNKRFIYFTLSQQEENENPILVQKLGSKKFKETFSKGYVIVDLTNEKLKYKVIDNKTTKSSSTRKIPIEESEFNEDVEISNDKHYKINPFTKYNLNDDILKITKYYDINRNKKFMNPSYVKSNVLNKHKDWTFTNDTDYDQDGYEDSVILDSKGNPKVFNGYYYVSPKYTRELNKYYIDNPDAKIEDYKSKNKYIIEHNLNNIISTCFNNSFKQLDKNVQNQFKNSKDKLKNWFKRFIICPFLIKYYINDSVENKNILMEKLLTTEDINNPLNNNTYKSAINQIKKDNHLSKNDFNDVITLIMNVFKGENVIRYLSDFINNNKVQDLLNIGDYMAKLVYNNYNK